MQVAALSGDGTQVTVIAPLTDFWADAAGYLTGEPAGETLPAAEVQLVPPVLPDARVICIGLNYLKHVAEGSMRDEPLPEFPTLFARWTRSLTVDGAEVPGPVQRGRPGLGGRDRRLRRRPSGRSPPRTRRWPPSSATRRSTT